MLYVRGPRGVSVCGGRLSYDLTTTIIRQASY
jgi:hypothetical protein